MADNLPDAMEKALADYYLKTAGSTAMTQITSSSIWAGLCSTTPTETTTNEVTTGLNGYARAQVIFVTAASGDAGCLGPSAAVSFPSASGSWGTINGYGLFPYSTGSSGVSAYLAWGVVSPTVAVTTNDTVSFAASALTLAFG
jgi:hypothetical protein